MKIRHSTIKWSYGKVGYKMCIPTPESPLPKPVGYIETSPVDRYENACFHVAPIQSIFSDGKERFTYEYTYWDTPSNPRYEDYVGAGVGNYFAWNSRSNGDLHVKVLTGSRFENYVKDWGDRSIPPLDFLSARSVMDWLEDHDFRHQSSEVIKNITSYEGDGFLIGERLDKKTAYKIADKFYKENPWDTALDDAYFEALAQLKLNTNNFQNLASVAKAAKSLLNLRASATQALGQFKTLTTKERLSQIWLSYRYQYTTTKLDLREAERAIEQISRDTGIIRTGCTVSNAACRLKIRYSPYENEMLEKILSFYSSFQRIGLDPSLYNLWDLVPFSFIVDWFLPVGDNLERIANQRWAATMPYTVESLASIKGTTEYEGCQYKVYRRFPFSPNYDWTWVSPDGASMTTWTKRAMDVIALK